MDIRRFLTGLWGCLIPIGLGLGFYLLFSGLWGILGRFIAFICFIGILIFTSVLFVVIGPKRIQIEAKDWDIPTNQYRPQGYDATKWNILLDTHFHTLYSDGQMTIEEGIKWHIAMGFNAFFVTDHETTDNFDEILTLQAKYKEQCLVLPGVELAGALGHLNVIGLTHKWDFSMHSNFKTAEDVQAIVKAAHEQGALVSWNHYPWSYYGKIPRFSYVPPRELVMSWGVDFIEAVNWDDDIDTIDRVSYDFCMQHPSIAPVVGTDVHAPEKDRLYGWTLVQTDAFTPEALMKALHKKQNDVLFMPGGIAYPTKHKPSNWFLLFRPLYEFGDIFFRFHQGGAIRNLDWHAVSIWILYVLGLYGFLEFLFFIAHL
jgi:hypothetical protein